MNYVLDTNIILYYLGGMLDEALPKGDHFCSVVSEMELLSYPTLSLEEETAIEEFLGTINLVELSKEIRECAVILRRQNSLRLPDAIIAATTVILNATLVTNDLRLSRIQNLTCMSLKTKKIENNL